MDTLQCLFSSQLLLCCHFANSSPWTWYLADCPALYYKAKRNTVATHNICIVFVGKPVSLYEKQSMMRNETK